MNLINNRCKLYLLFLGAIIAVSTPLDSQSTKESLADARKYVQDLAIQATSDQIVVQNKIKLLNELKHPPIVSNAIVNQVNFGNIAMFS